MITMQPPLAPRVTLKYDVERRDDWTVPEETVPESRPHDLTLDLLKALLSAWAARTGRNAQVGRNLAVRWNEENPRIGTDPDIYVVEPPPPEGDQVESLRLWVPGHHPLLLAIEVVSPNNALKDYAQAPDKHAVAGTRELWVFDPDLRGPRAHGGPVRLQIWSRRPDDSFERSYAGDGPAFSPVLGAWLFPTGDGQVFRIADDPGGDQRWLTALEQAEIRSEQERQAKEAALARVAELEAALARR